MTMSHARPDRASHYHILTRDTPFWGVSFFVLVSVKLAFGKPLSTVLFVRWALFRFAVLRGALFDPPRYTKTLHATHSIDSCA